LIVVSFLFVLAERSGKWYLYALALLGGFALWGTVYSYTEEWRPNLAVFKQRWLAALVALLLAVLVLVPLVMAMSVGFQAALRELVRVQGQ
jgi:hypothetical protein